MAGKTTKRTKQKPSDREKKRYLVLLSDQDRLKGLLRDLSRQEWRIIDWKNDRILLKLKLKYLNEFKKMLCKQGISCIGISGTVKRAKQKFWNQKVAVCVTTH